VSDTFFVPTLGEYEYDINLSKLDKFKALDLLKNMLQIRLFEKLCAKQKENGVIGGPVHLAIGQEAIPVGISAFINNTDYVFSAHRSHAHLLALGSNPRELFAEILGKSTGLVGGFGGSMHLADKSVGFHGSVPIVAGTVPLALGAAFACKRRAENSIAVSYFGDGALEEGVVQESLNIASVMNLPILFVCENNLMASHMHLSQRQSLSNLDRFAKATDVQSIRIDGNNISDVYLSAQTAIESIRNSGAPFFIEAITFRQLGHVDWREDIDVGVTRSLNEVNEWKKFDPIVRLKNSMIKNGFSTVEEISEIDVETQKILNDALKAALEDDYPGPNLLMKFVFSESNR
jgi:pyruvate dehydrogenase E1 component alpha subunit